MIAFVSDSSSDDDVMTLSSGVSPRPKHQQTAMMGYRVPAAKRSRSRLMGRRAHLEDLMLLAKDPFRIGHCQARSQRVLRRNLHQILRLKDADSVVISPIREAQPIP